MSKKKGPPPPSKPMQKMYGRPRKEERHTSDDFRHCRPKRDWAVAAPADGL